jgi:uridine kinase
MNDTIKQMVEIECINTNNKVLIPSGLALIDIINFVGIKNPETILGACVNNKVQNLSYRIYSPKNIMFLDINSSNGKRMYALSLMFLTYKAAKNIFPNSELYIKHSMNGGYYAELDNLPIDINIAVEKIKKEMKKLVKEDLPFERKIVPQQQAAELFEKVGLKEKARLIRNSKRLYANIDILNDTINSFFFELIPSTSYLKVFDIQPFDKGFIILMPDKEQDYLVPEKIIPQTKLFSIFQEHKHWVEILHTPYITDVNDMIRDGKQNELIQISEALHEKKYASIADSIYKKKDNVKLVLLAGPSSSGKTTSCRRLATQLSVLGIKPLQISLDDYFLDRAHTPRDEKGDYDFECLEALDLDFFNHQMNELLKGNEIELPKFNFVIGQREKSNNKIHLTDDSMIIVEGIHALNPKLSKEIARKNKYFVFVSALTQIALDRHNLISTSDNRLIRRIVRDYNYRGASAENTINRWESVRHGEETHIFPFQENADSIFNSSLLYEIGVLKTYCEPLLMDVAQSSPAYANARRLHQFLNNFLSIKGDFIPPTSIMREFLGGSSFKY